LELLWKEDIRQYNLLDWSCHPWWGKTIFDYFVDWDPEALKHCNDDGDNIEFIYTTVNQHVRFDFALEAGLRHYPEELGLLFRKDDDGDAASELAIQVFGKDESWKVIEKCLDETRDKEKITEMNPVMNLYPFMLAAAGDKNVLNMIYYLLRRNSDCISQLEGLDCSAGSRKRTH